MNKFFNMLGRVALVASAFAGWIASLIFVQWVHTQKFTYIHVFSVVTEATKESAGHNSNPVLVILFMIWTIFIIVVTGWFLVEE